MSDMWIAIIVVPCMAVVGIALGFLAHLGIEREPKPRRRKRRNRAR